MNEQQIKDYCNLYIQQYPDAIQIDITRAFFDGAKFALQLISTKHE